MYFIIVIIIIIRRHYCIYSYCLWTKTVSVVLSASTSEHRAAVKVDSRTDERLEEKSMVSQYLTFKIIVCTFEIILYGCVLYFVETMR